LYTGENAVEIKSEAASDDMTECPRDDRPSTGMFIIIIIIIIGVCWT